MDSSSGATRRKPLAVMCDVQRPEQDFYRQSEEHRQIARAAIRVALRHGIPDSEIMAEYEVVQEVERNGR